MQARIKKYIYIWERLAVQDVEEGGLLITCHTTRVHKEMR